MFAYVSLCYVTLLLYVFGNTPWVVRKKQIVGVVIIVLNDDGRIQAAVEDSTVRLN